MNNAIINLTTEIKHLSAKLSADSCILHYTIFDHVTAALSLEVNQQPSSLFALYIHFCIISLRPLIYHFWNSLCTCCHQCKLTILFLGVCYAPIIHGILACSSFCIQCFYDYCYWWHLTILNSITCFPPLSHSIPPMAGCAPRLIARMVLPKNALPSHGPGHP